MKRGFGVACGLSVFLLACTFNPTGSGGMSGASGSGTTTGSAGSVAASGTAGSSGSPGTWIVLP